jgi:hypothetical protein
MANITITEPPYTATPSGAMPGDILYFDSSSSAYEIQRDGSLRRILLVRDPETGAESIVHLDRKTIRKLNRGRGASKP